MSDVKSINDSNFAAEVEQSSAPVLVDFWAEWCMPCKALTPVIEELATEYDGKVTFTKMNVDESRETPAKFGIRGIPTLILFKDGEKVDELVGNQSKEKIKELLDKVSTTA